MIRTGFPHTTEFSGIFLHTTLPTPIITLLPMEVFPKIIKLYGTCVLASWAISVE